MLFLWIVLGPDEGPRVFQPQFLLLYIFSLEFCSCFGSHSSSYYNFLPRLQILSQTQVLIFCQVATALDLYVRFSLAMSFLPSDIFHCFLDFCFFQVQRLCTYKHGPFLSYSLLQPQYHNKDLSILGVNAYLIDNLMLSVGLKGHCHSLNVPCIIILAQYPVSPGSALKYPSHSFWIQEEGLNN